MMKKILIFLFIAALSFTANAEEKPAIVLVKNSKGILSFKVSLQKEGKVTVDWGNKNIQTYDVNASTRFDEAIMISEEAGRNTEIKIYGKNIKLFSCIDQFVTNLDVSNAKELVYLNCSRNYIKDLDLSNNLALRTFNCNSNRIKTLNISKNKRLVTLIVNYNFIRNISLGNHPILQYLNVADNHFKTLDLSKNKSLKNLFLSGNKLSTIDITHLKGLSHLDVSYNKFSACELNKIFNEIPAISEEDKPTKKNLMINFNRGVRGSNTTIATTKNWDPDVMGKGYAKCN